MGGSELAELTPSTVSNGSSQVYAAHHRSGSVPAAFKGVSGSPVISDTPQTAPAAAGGAKAVQHKHVSQSGVPTLGHTQCAYFACDRIKHASHCLGWGG